MSEKKIYDFLIDRFEKKNFFKSIDYEVNNDESLTDQSYYTIADLIKTFIREKSTLIANAKEIKDEDAPDCPIVDAYDDIIDLQNKIDNYQVNNNDKQEKVAQASDNKATTTTKKNDDDDDDKASDATIDNSEVKDK